VTAPAESDFGNFRKRYANLGTQSPAWRMPLGRQSLWANSQALGL